jgi:hypothetical protein
MWRTLFGMNKSRERLASAFVGEIAAAMETLEANPEIKFLASLAEGAGGTTGQSNKFALPKFSVYEKNASRLGEFAAPLPRELSYFYTEMEALDGRIRNALLHEKGAASRKAAAAEAVAEVRRVVNLGDQLLRDLRPLVSRHHSSSSTTRA